MRPPATSILGFILAAALPFASGGLMPESRADEASEARAAEMESLLTFLKAKGIDLRPKDDKQTKGSYIQSWFTIGPDHAKRHLVGLNYLPPLTLDQAQDLYKMYSVAHEFHDQWALFMIGVADGDGDAYERDYEKVSAAFQAYPGRGKTGKK